MFSVFSEIFNLTEHVVLNVDDGLLHLVFRCNKDVGRIYFDAVELFNFITIVGVERVNGFNGIVPELNAVGNVGIGREDFNDVASYPEVAPIEVAFGA